MSRRVRTAAAAGLAGTVLVAQAVPADDLAAAVLEEVVVTAQKRTQDLQQIGISISVLSAQDLDELMVWRSEDVAAYMPNVSVKNVYGNSFPIITIRGVGFNIFQSNQSSAAAIHVDEVYLGSPALLGFSLFDVARVEVLKGPQGTLYGRNTTAGNINYVTERPAEEFEARAKLSYGRFDETRTEMVLNGALAPTVNGRLSGLYHYGDGWIDNELADRHGAGANILALRGQLDWAPSEDLDLLLRVHGGRDHSKISYYKPTGTLCPPGVAPNRTTCTDFLGYSDPDSDPWTVHSNLTGRYDNPAYGASLTFDWRGEAATLTSITAYDHFDRRYRDDLDSSPNTVAEQNYDESFHQFSQELRLAAPAEAALQWIGGAYFAEDRIELFRDADISDISGLLGAPPPFVFLMNVDQKTQAGALFGQIEWPFAQRWSLTAGARWTREQKQFDYDNELLIGGPPPIPNASVHGLEETWNDLSGKIGLDFALSDDLLIYGSVSKGFKSGGFPAGTTLSAEQIVPYDPEKLIAYELGLKSTLLDRRLRVNGALFYYDYRDKQEFAYIPAAIPGAPPNQVLTNAGKARLYGLEAEVTWRATEHLELAAGLGLLDTEIREFRSVQLEDQSIVGNRLPNAPQTNINGRVRYEIPLRNGSSIAASANGSYESDVYFDIQNDPTRAEGGHAVFDASLSWTSADELWMAGMWGRNLGNRAWKIDSQDFSLGFLIDTYAPPRTYGISLTRNWR
jgi:iron complex outermembrane receptor protein